MSPFKIAFFVYVRSSFVQLDKYVEFNFRLLVNQVDDSMNKLQQCVIGTHKKICSPYILIWLSLRNMEQGKLRKKLTVIDLTSAPDSHVLVGGAADPEILHLNKPWSQHAASACINFTQL
jgi:hypothetical protein